MADSRPQNESKTAQHATAQLSVITIEPAIAKIAPPELDDASSLHETTSERRMSIELLFTLRCVGRLI
jgi:hypothetical protein